MGIAVTKIPVAENSDQFLHFVDFYYVIREVERDYLCYIVALPGSLDEFFV